MAYLQELIKPYSAEGGKREQVGEMFDNIAPVYDRLNHLFSFGIDSHWRRYAIKELGKHEPQTILDMSTGTGDFAILTARLLKPQSVVGADISEGMMQVGRRKVEAEGLSQVISFQREDCERMSFPDASFDAVTVAFGVRNYEHLDACLREMGRVLREGGQLLIIELSSPKSFPMRQLFHLYSHTLMPLVGRMASHDGKAYDYLTASIEAFPTAETMTEILKKNGFRLERLKLMSCGICTMYLATPNK
ncbi:MAG: bifunctional demethylmenaquinone methyltransferase/2-methoxy-6-polyprenyl-1,4-benzoquinol methylase UbiE [Prevotellaceae bacterium]|nr:bifunctional demethylmenaquinone methyltransferase/2-methoxy-6-polyprenyl-1,4-benzoquinol methylase UbiE [Prevotellaceae bacterium]